MSTLAWPRPEALDEVVSPAGAPPEERPSTLPPPSGVVAAGAGLPASLIGTQIRLSSEAGEFVALVEGIYGSGDGATSWIKLTVESAEQGTIHMASNGEWFKLPNGHVVQLRRHPSKGRMLAELLRARLSQPGEFVTHEQLIAIENQLPAMFELAFAFSAWSLPESVLLARGIRPALVVPEIAVQQIGSETFVWRVKADDSVEKANVVVGGRVPGKVMLKDGVKAGERIVTEGVGKLQAGAKIAAGRADAAPAGAAK